MTGQRELAIDEGVSKRIKIHLLIPRGLCDIKWSCTPLLMLPDFTMFFSPVVAEPCAKF